LRLRKLRVSVRLFAGLTDVVGQREIVMELRDGATIDQLRDQLGREYPAVVPFLPTLVCAVDDEYVPASHALREGDDVSLIPPVSGGSAELGLFDVTAEPLDPARLVEAVRRDESGAVVLFYGVARNHSDGRRVRALEYEAHASLAVKKLQEVAEEVAARYPIDAVGALHRVGHLAIGETSLLVAVASAHRQEAFEAAQYAVDRIKQIVPIWKKEIWEDGGGAWVLGHAVELPDRAEARPGGR
jgi:molybdopterin synthase catalytic subunit